MKAVVRQKYGPPEVLKLEDVATPAPADDEILIRVVAASINLGDWELLTGRPRFISVLAHLFSREQQYEFASTSVTAGKGGIFPPKAKILGTDVAGHVEAVGKNVTRFQVGDEIFGMAEGFGAFAEYVCVSATVPMVNKPASMSFEQAAALPQATHIALQAIRDKAQVQSDQTVLINGAGGGAGTLAVQLAKMYGAKVTGVDGPTKLDMLRSIGADHVIDYTQVDFNRNGERYDAILDMAAYRNVFKSRRSLTTSGIYLMGGGSGTATWQSALLGPVISTLGSRRVVFLLAESRREDLIHIGELFEAGKVTLVIDRSYPLCDAGEALRRVGEKQGIGKVIIVP
jgi:NADPH:quinone reductase-like Zn-dependent oxidoreductase